MYIFLPVRFNKLVILYNNISLHNQHICLLFSCWTLVGAAGEALGLDLTTALEQVAAPHAVAVSPVLAGGGGVTSHA